MKKETENIVTSPINNTEAQSPIIVPYFIFSAINVLFKASVISASMAAITYPISKMSFNLMRYQNVLGPTSENMSSTRRMVMALYKGAHATMKANVVRGAYVESSKMIQKKSIEDEIGAATMMKYERNIEEVSSKNMITLEPQIEQAARAQLESTIKEMTITASMSLIDTLVTKFIYMKSMLAMNGLQVDLNKWANIQKAYRTGLGSQVISGCISFFALCKLDSWYATKLQWMNQEKHSVIAGFAPGALAGMTAATFTLPLNLYKDYACSKLTATNGLLTGPSAKELFSSLIGQAKQAGFRGSWDYGRQQLLKQLPLRMLNTGLMFGIISYVNRALGDRPLEKASEKFDFFKNLSRITSQTTKMPSEENAVLPSEETLTKNKN